MKNTDTEWVNQIILKYKEKVKLESNRLGESIPYIPYNGKYSDVVVDRGLDWWTNGFYSGILWQLYHLTKEDYYREQAEIQENRLVDALYQFKDIHHDVGFLFLHTAVANYRLTGNEQSFRTGLHAANLLSGRFNPKGNFIVAWNNEPGYIIIDSMMNLPLLYWASDVTDDPRFKIIAQLHAETVRKYLVREDGSVGHIAHFDATSGHFIELIGGQGYSANSAWSRGNAWAIYGFALSYRYTLNPSYLEIAKKVANYFISEIEKTNYIPRVDFKAPDYPEIYDTSAGVCAACGLLEIANYSSEVEKDKYRNIAFNILQSTEKKYANWDKQTDGIITGGTEAYHRPSTYHVPLIYADYFFGEALLSLVNKSFMIW